jgi:hypothetical protein
MNTPTSGVQIADSRLQAKRAKMAKVVDWLSVGMGSTGGWRPLAHLSQAPTERDLSVGGGFHIPVAVARIRRTPAMSMDRRNWPNSLAAWSHQMWITSQLDISFAGIAIYFIS